MEQVTNSNKLYRATGWIMLAQAVLPLTAGLLFQSLEVKGNTAASMSNLTAHLPLANLSVLLWIVAAFCVVILGILLYEATKTLSKPLAAIACSMYLLEAFLVVVGQVFVVALLKTSVLSITSGGTSLTDIGSVLLSCRHIAGELAMIPFGVGAVIYYSLLMKAKTLPKWLAIWGIVTAPLIMVGVPLATFGVSVPAAVLAPYVPFEFFTGAFLLIRYRKK
ncbi:MAG TPA: DUF4386 domain-containing protein [Clostridia bacterium]|nr:DUF4386 domain-containing protein [Clostridia bacterium]